MSNESDLKLEIAHVLLIDVVGYSKLFVHQQIEVLRELNRIVRQAPHFLAAEEAGALTRLPTGDGMALLFFDSAELPIMCALEVSHAAKEIPSLQLRMGAHSGPIKAIPDVNDQANYAGAGLNIAQRVLDCGDAGHILLSQRIADDLASYAHWHSHLTDLGECEVKHGVRLRLFNLCRDGLGNPLLPEKIHQQRRRLHRWRSAIAHWSAGSLARKVALVAVPFLAAVVLGLLAWRFSQPPTIGRIAVLPFGNSSDEKGNQYFIDGVLDEIEMNLSKVDHLTVICRSNSVARYVAEAGGDTAKIAKALRVRHVLTGSVQRFANRIRIHVQLIDARTNEQLWANQYDRELADVFAIQTEVAEEIAAQLRLKLSPAVKAAIEEEPTKDLDAYEHYVHAKALINSSVLSLQANEDLNEATELLNKAVRSDPQFFLAYTQLAHAQDQLYLRFDHTPARRALADAAIQTVVRLRPNSSEAHLALGKHYYWAYRDYDRARQELLLAQNGLSSDSSVPLILGYIDRRQGKWDESIKHMERALELDPQNTLILQQISLTYCCQGRFREMSQALARAVRLAPNDVVLRTQSAAVEMEWHAETQPLHQEVQSILAQQPRAAVDLADLWLDLALAERDHSAALRALEFMGREGCHVEEVPFPRSWCEGVAARTRGDEAAARAAFSKARDEISVVVRDQPEYGGAMCVLGMVDAALGDKDAGIREGLRAVQLWPISEDATYGPLAAGYLAIIYAWTGEKDLAFEQLKRATSVPSFWTYGNLRLHPQWDPLRDDPRFDELISSSARK